LTGINKEVLYLLAIHLKWNHKNDNIPAGHQQRQ